jgi:hypothetical protein
MGIAHIAAAQIIIFIGLVPAHEIPAHPENRQNINDKDNTVCYMQNKVI